MGGGSGYQEPWLPPWGQATCSKRCCGLWGERSGDVTRPTKCPALHACPTSAGGCRCRAAEMGHGRGMCRARDGTGCIIDAVIQHQWAVKWFRFHEQKFPPSTAQCVLLHSHGHWEGAAFAACLAGNAWPTTGCRVQRQQQLRDRKFGAQHQATGAACAQKAPACTYTHGGILRCAQHCVVLSLLVAPAERSC